MKIIIKFYKFVLRYKLLFLLSLLTLTLGQIADNYSMFVFKDLVDNISKTDFNTSLLYGIAGFYVGAKIIGTLLRSLGSFLNDRYISKAGSDLKATIVTHIHNLDFSFHAQKQSGGLISTIKRGDNAFWDIDFSLNRNINVIIVDYIFILVTFSTLNYKLALAIFATIVLNLVAAKFILQNNIRARRRFNEEEDKISGLIVDNMINYETVKLFAQEKWEQKRLRDKLSVWMKYFYKYSNTFRFISIVSNLIGALGAGGTMILAINMLNNNEITAGELSLVIAFITTFFPKLSTLTFEIRNIVKNLTDLDKYFGILDIPIDVKDKEDAMILKSIKGNIGFNKIDFAYPNRERVFKNIDLQISPGESVALVGYSGAGKTTLIKLLLRFYDVTSGSITIDEQDIRDVTKTSLRKNIGLVPQEPVLFNDTIGFNIAYPQPEATKKDIKAAARLANLDEFIEGLPERYDTVVGERGIKLSGGQKQRLAIARMFLADPKIIVFDEATSQLDSESEQLIQDAFWRIAKDKTTLIIAHRLSTVMRADRIIVIDKGRIIEEGTHSELVHKGTGLYNKLWQMQRGNMLIE